MECGVVLHALPWKARLRSHSRAGQRFLDMLDLDVALFAWVVLVVDLSLGGNRLGKVRALAEVRAVWQNR